MVDKSIGELVAASQINDTDLFVLEQSGEAKKLLGNLLKQYITRNVMSVSVSALPPDSEPTVSYDPITGTLELGIPRGEKGESGESSAGYVSGIVKGDGAGNVSAAVPGTDFAPAGYGLGGAGVTVSNADDAVNNGWYKVPAPAGFGAGQLWCMVSALSSTYITQTLYIDVGNGRVAMRFKLNGTWYPWEWVNPPMQAGVEFRTTERYLGKPVYVKIVDFGTLPNATGKNVSIGVNDFAQFVDFRVSMKNKYMFNIYEAGLSQVSIGETGNISIRTKVDMTAYSAYVIVKYTKTTD